MPVENWNKKDLSLVPISRIMFIIGIWIHLHQVRVQYNSHLNCFWKLYCERQRHFLDFVVIKRHKSCRHIDELMVKKVWIKKIVIQNLFSFFNWFNAMMKKPRGGLKNYIHSFSIDFRPIVFSRNWCLNLVLYLMNSTKSERWPKLSELKCF